MSASEFLKAKDELYDKVLQEVSNSVADLKELDHWRNVEFPRELVDRFKRDELLVTKPELQKLMDWKLKKGKFRPTLKKLIAQNDDQDVESITREGFNILIEAKDTKPSKDEYKKLIKKSMTTLVKLRGVGPATASLLLSTLNKVTNLAPPFYSDEAAEYIFSQNGESETKLKYSMSEYIKWLDLMWEFNEDYQFDYTDLENGIWTLKKNEYYEIKPQKADDINGPSGDDNKQEDDHDIIKSRKKRKVAK